VCACPFLAFRSVSVARFSKYSERKEAKRREEEQKWHLAGEHYERSLITRAFNGLKKYLLGHRYDHTEAWSHFCRQLAKRHFAKWLAQWRVIQRRRAEEKERQLQELWRKAVLIGDKAFYRYYFSRWRRFVFEKKRARREEELKQRLRAQATSLLEKLRKERQTGASSSSALYPSSLLYRQSTLSSSASAFPAAPGLLLASSVNAPSAVSTTAPVASGESSSSNQTHDCSGESKPKTPSILLPSQIL